MNWDRNWNARWIWVEDYSTTTATIFQFDNAHRPPDTFAFFRRTWLIDAVPSSAQCRVTADGRYQLFVDGTRVGRGPIRSEPCT